jgi:hypothetical protein
MAAVLHIVDRSLDREDAAAVRAWIAGQPGEHVVLPPGPADTGLLRWRRRHELLAALRRGCVLVHAWGEGALDLALSQTATLTRFTPLGMPSRRVAKQLRRLNRVPPVQLVAAARWLEPLLRATGGEMCPSLPHVGLRPADATTPREAVRERLGFAPDERIVFVPGAMTRRSGHVDAVWAGVLAHVLDRRVRLVITGRGPTTARGREFAENMRQGAFCVPANDAGGGAFTTADLTRAADAVLLPPGNDVSPVAIAAVLREIADRPLLAPPTVVAAAALAGVRNVRWAGGVEPKLLAEAIVNAWSAGV